MIQNNPPCPCCETCLDCDTPSYIQPLAGTISYSNKIGLTEMVSPSSTVRLDGQSIELHAMSGYHDLVTSESYVPTFYGKPVESYYVGIQWDMNLVNNIENCESYFRKSGGNVQWECVATISTMNSGLRYSQAPLNLVSSNGSNGSNRTFIYRSQLKESNPHYTYGGGGTPGCWDNIKAHEEVELIVRANESRRITEPSGTDAYNATNWDNTSEMFVTLLCSGDPYTLAFKCAPSIDYDGEFLQRRYGLGAGNGRSDKENLDIHYSGAKPTKSTVGGVQVYPAIFQNYSDFDYPRGGYKLQPAQWKLYDAWKGTKSSQGDTIDVLPNGLLLSNSKLCVTVTPQANYNGEVSPQSNSIDLKASRCTESKGPRFYAPAIGRYFNSRDELNDLSATITLNCPWPEGGMANRTLVMNPVGGMQHDCDLQRNLTFMDNNIYNPGLKRQDFDMGCVAYGGIYKCGAKITIIDLWESCPSSYENTVLGRVFGSLETHSFTNKIWGCGHACKCSWVTSREGRELCEAHPPECDKCDCYLQRKIFDDQHITGPCGFTDPVEPLGQGLNWCVCQPCLRSFGGVFEDLVVVLVSACEQFDECRCYSEGYARDGIPGWLRRFHTFFAWSCVGTYTVKNGWDYTSSTGEIAANLNNDVIIQGGSQVSDCNTISLTVF